MTTAILEPTALAGSQLLTQEMSALIQGQGQVLRPPFAGSTVWKSFDPDLFDSADRQNTDRGEVTVQLGLKRQAVAVGRVESVLWHNLRVMSSGFYRVTVRADTGPITRIGLTVPSVRSFIGGCKSSNQLQTQNYIGSHQTYFLGYTVNLQASCTYKLFCLGSVLIFHRFPSLPLSYGEVVATFPQISVIPFPLVDDPFQSHIESALEKADDDEAIEALAKELPKMNLYGSVQPD